MKVMVAYDGSVCGDGALYDLASAGLPAGTEILILTVANPFPRFIPSLEPDGSGWDSHAPEADREVAAETLGEAESMAERAGRYLESMATGWKIRIRAMLELPAQGILSQADAWKPDLIVMGSHGRTSLGRLILGSVSQKVLLHSRHHVRICRARIGFDAPAPRLLLAMDGSPGSFAALDALAARDWPEGTQVRLLAVAGTREAMEGMLSGSGLGPELFRPQRPLPLRPQPLRPEPNRAGRKAGRPAGKPEGIRSKRARAADPGTAPSGTGRSAADFGYPAAWIGERLKEAAGKLAAKGLSVMPEVRLGDPRRVILHQAKHWPAHCIFMGSRGLNPFQRFLLGSVSTAVAFHATCSVEVIRQAKQSAPGEGKEGKTQRAGLAKSRHTAMRISFRIRKSSAPRRKSRAGGSNGTAKG